MDWTDELAEFAILEREVEDFIASQKELCSRIAAFLSKPIRFEAETGCESAGAYSKSYPGYAPGEATGDELQRPNGRPHNAHRQPYRSRSPDWHSEEAYRSRQRSRSRDRCQGQDYYPDGLPNWQNDDHLGYQSRERNLGDDYNFLDRDGGGKATNLRSEGEKFNQTTLNDGDESENNPNKSNGVWNEFQTPKTADGPHQLYRPALFPQYHLPLESPRPTTVLNAAIGSKKSPISIRTSDSDDTPSHVRNTNLLCSACGTQFGTALELKYHKPDCTSQKVPAKVISPSQITPLKQICSYCKKILLSRKHLFEHLRTCNLVKSGVIRDTGAAPDITILGCSTAGMLDAEDSEVDAQTDLVGDHEAVSDTASEAETPTSRRKHNARDYELIDPIPQGQLRRNSQAVMHSAAPTRHRSSSSIESRPPKRRGRASRGRPRGRGRSRR
ncbi:hypothetical protein F4861DRAFT_541457 [Xylaria intraflava]|nr:hypothetical protein F4861DRAFT_541457 [Xylaria intraflava]